MDPRPNLDDHFGIQGVEAQVTLPGGEIFQTRAIEIGPYITEFPADSGNNSVVKSRRQFGLRLDAFGGLKVEYGTKIVAADETFYTKATTYEDNQVGVYIVSKELLQ